MVLRALFCVLWLCCCGAGSAESAESDLTEREFVVKDFRLESGQVWPLARIRYVTTGRRDQRAENVVLVPSWYSCTIEDNLYLVDAEAGIDPAMYLVVFTELFGSGKSSSSSNTAKPCDGPRFPVTTIRDNVRICHQLLFGRLKVRRLCSVVGFSRRAQQAFQWAVCYPDQVESTVPVCVTATTYHHGVVRLESAISCLQADANWNNGDLLGPLEKGAEAWARHWAAWVYSPAWWRKNCSAIMGMPVPRM